MALISPYTFGAIVVQPQRNVDALDKMVSDYNTANGTAWTPTQLVTQMLNSQLSSRADAADPLKTNDIDALRAMYVAKP